MVYKKNSKQYLRLSNLPVTGGRKNNYNNSVMCGSKQQQLPPRQVTLPLSLSTRDVVKFVCLFVCLHKFWQWTQGFIPPWLRRPIQFIIIIVNTRWFWKQPESSKLHQVKDEIRVTHSGFFCIVASFGGFRKLRNQPKHSWLP